MRSAAAAVGEPGTSPGRAPVPFLKWAGGKRQLLPRIERLLPPRIATYYEPFLGGAALFFHLAARRRFERAVLTDANPELVNCYQVIQAKVDAVIAELRKKKYRNDHDQYYVVRAEEVGRLSPIGRAARFIYLNRCGYNGLYRVNRKGRFNVPFGRYRNPVICDEEKLRAAARALNEVDVTVEERDFSEAAAGACEGDFVYFDPPYVPVSKTSSFTAYAARQFGTLEQQRLADLLRALGAGKVPALLSNSYSTITRKLYRDLDSVRVAARRSINSVARGRGPIEELLVRSFAYRCAKPPGD